MFTPDCALFDFSLGLAVFRKAAANPNLAQRIISVGLSIASSGAR
jgi:hypothetical protein